MGGAREGPLWADALWLVPAGAGGSPLCTHALWGGRRLWLWGAPTHPPCGCRGVHAHLWGAHLCRACGGGPGVHLHAGTHVCRRVRAGTRMGTGGTTLRPPPRRGVPEACKCMYIYKYKYIYIHCAHRHVCSWRGGLGGSCPRVTPACPSRPGGTCTGTVHTCPYARVALLA